LLLLVLSPFWPNKSHKCRTGRVIDCKLAKAKTEFNKNFGGTTCGVRNSLVNGGQYIYFGLEKKAEIS